MDRYRQCCFWWIRNDFFRSGSYFPVDFGSVPGSCFGSYMNFFLIFLTEILPLYTCLESVQGCSLWGDISLLGKYFFYKKEFVFWNWAFLLRNGKILSFFQSSFTSKWMIFSGSVSCSGSRLKFRNNRIRIHKLGT